MPDNLNRIKDIGSAREKWLNEHGIETYENLAGADPIWIYEQFKNEGKLPISLEKIQGWIAQAKAIITPEPEPGQVTQSIPSQNSSNINEDEWVEFASFYITYSQHKHSADHPSLRTQVEYRTYADHVEPNDTEQWDDIEGDELCKWIMRHVETIINETQPETMPVTAIASAMISSVNHDSVRVLTIQVRDSLGGIASASAGELFKGMVHTQCPLSFDFKIELPPVSQKGEPVDCKLSLYVYEMPGDLLILKPQKMVQLQVDHRTNLGVDTLVIPGLPAGLYRIRAIATLLAQTPILNVLDISLLQVL